MGSANAASFVPRTKKVSERGGSTDAGSAPASCPSETGVVPSAVAEASEEEDDYDDVIVQPSPLELLSQLRPPTSPSAETLPIENEEGREAPVEIPLPRF